MHRECLTAFTVGPQPDAEERLARDAGPQKTVVARAARHATERTNACIAASVSSGFSLCGE